MNCLQARIAVEEIHFNERSVARCRNVDANIALVVLGDVVRGDAVKSHARLRAQDRITIVDFLRRLWTKDALAKRRAVSRRYALIFAGISGALVTWTA